MPSCAHTTSRCVAPMWRVVDEGGQLLRLLHFPHLMHLCVCVNVCVRVRTSLQEMRASPLPYELEDFKPEDEVRVLSASHSHIITLTHTLTHPRTHALTHSLLQVDAVVNDSLPPTAEKEPSA